MTNNQPLIKQLFWHDIKTVEASKIARIPALVLSIFGTFLWALISVATIIGHKSIDGYWAIFYFIFFTLISWGLFKMRREAAIASMIVSIIAVISEWGNMFRFVLALGGILVALLAIRATYSYARLYGKNEKTQQSN